MADSVVPGVWWLHGTRGSNVYLLETADDRLVLVDSGFASSALAVLHEVRSLAAGRPVSHVLLTHHHVDHAGAAMELRAALGARVVAGSGDCSPDGRGGHLLHEPLGPSHRWRRLLRRLAGAADASPITAVDEPLEGERPVLPGLLAIPVPGHTPGSYCYLDQTRGVAFVGDLVISHLDGVARPLPFTNQDDAMYLASLRAFAARAPVVGCPGHGPPVVGGFAQQLAELASLPRRHPLSPVGMRDRARRMTGFARQMARARGRADRSRGG